VPDEIEEVPLPPQLLGVSDPLADVGAGQARGRSTPWLSFTGVSDQATVDRSTAGDSEEMLLLAAHVREDALAKRGRLLGHGKDVPDRSGPARLSTGVVVVLDPARPAPSCR